MKAPYRVARFDQVAWLPNISRDFNLNLHTMFSLRGKFSDHACFFLKAYAESMPLKG